MSTNTNKSWVSRHKILTVILVIVALIIIGAIFNGSKDNEVKGNSTATTKVDSNDKEKSQENVEKSEEINYEVHDVDQLQDELEANALKASDTYKNKYVELKGKLGDIDSSGEYFSVMSLNKEFEFIGIHCNIENDDQGKIVADLNKDDVIIVRGKISDVGEFLGYTLETHGITKVQ